ncbi:hypothetical protein [Allomuricauda sp. SCSIO 65647]|uniref:hypothetical protein n=1 Tax=Allomuricauda sp. SCSIO 65647 TaxID=2908843 RepID=UPI001F2A1278|nr:hypothetical protein [Muricauda sp. SCSIO 65647]UJH67568.1 hypothetical protein L0P89_16670 [Muricauda sp. SCSIO 65647]
MRKTLGILALLVFGLGTIACEAETNLEETEALFENLDDTACDGCGSSSSDRDGQ